MRVAVVSSLCGFILAGTGVRAGEPPRVTVVLLLFDEPSTVETTTDLDALGEPITDPGQLVPADPVYLEAWCQTTEPAGISTAVIDLTYQTARVDTTIEQLTIAEQWMDIFLHTVDDATGFIDDVGGINVNGLGADPSWAKIATVEFDVVETPSCGITFCSWFAGPGRPFGIAGQGSVPADEVDYGCLTIGTLPGDADADNTVDLTDYAHFQACMTGPGGGVPADCACADAQDDGDVDLADFAVIQRCFGDGP